MKPLDERSAKASQCPPLAYKDESVNDTASTELILDTSNKQQKCVRQNKGGKLFSPRSGSETDVQMKLKRGK